MYMCSPTICCLVGRVGRLLLLVVFVRRLRTVFMPCLDRGAHAAARGALEGDGRRLDRESLQYINHLGGEHSVVTGRRPHMAANTGHLARSSSSYMICKKGGGYILTHK